MILPFLAVATDAAVNVPGDSVTQIGIGGVFAIMVIKMVFDYTKGKKVINGYQRKASCDEIVKRFDNNFISQDKRFDKIDTQLEEVKDLIRNGN